MNSRRRMSKLSIRTYNQLEERKRRDSSSRSSSTPYLQEQKSRALEYYGFVAWTSTSALFFLYVLWALLPSEWLEHCGVTWYPNREWSILLPAYSIILILLTYFTYWALALFDTPSLDDPNTFIDSLGHDPQEKVVDNGAGRTSNPYIAAASSSSIPELYDIPIGLVNCVLYDDND